MFSRWLKTILASGLEPHVTSPHDSSEWMYAYLCLECKIYYKNPELIFLQILSMWDDYEGFGCNAKPRNFHSVAVVV